MSDEPEITVVPFLSGAPQGCLMPAPLPALEAVAAVDAAHYRPVADVTRPSDEPPSEASQPTP